MSASWIFSRIPTHTWHLFTAFSRLVIIPSACSVTVRKTVNHLSSFNSSLKTWLSFWTASHSASMAPCFLRMSASSFASSATNGVGVLTEFNRGSNRPLTVLIPWVTNSNRSSSVARDWSMTLDASDESPDCDLCLSSWISIMQESIMCAWTSSWKHSQLTENTCLYIRDWVRQFRNVGRHS